MKFLIMAYSGKYGYQIDTLYINFSEAFDKINYGFSLRKKMEVWRCSNKSYSLKIKLNRVLGFLIYTCPESTNINSIRILYMANVNSILSLASILWNFQYNINIHQLSNIQYKLIYHIFRKFYYNLVNFSYAINEFKFFSVTDRHFFSKLKFIFKVVNGTI